ncbi:MAG: relaxase/mobilization nuclease domain-containing protein [Steroidobacteraceae bacterium]
MNSAPGFDLFSYARRGPGRRDHLSQAEVAQIARTVHRTPEIMVKVLTQGAANLGAVRRHLEYIGRKGEVELETDDGRSLAGPVAGDGLLDDWNLELEEVGSRTALPAETGKPGPRLVHKLVFSMPAGTPAGRVLAVTRNFMREEFALQHRYAMALHTDEPHPHVHVVLKAVSEQGRRLHIRKATLRAWREGFARRLRAAGVEANATPRQVRGEVTPRKTDGIYRASQRGESTHMRERAQAAARTLTGRAPAESGKAKLVRTRQEAQRAWNVVGDLLMQQGRLDLSAEARRFAARMPPPMTEQEWIAARLAERTREPRFQEPMTR